MWLLRAATPEEIEETILINRIRNRKGMRWQPRALTAGRLQSWAAAGGIFIGAVVFLGPLLWEEYKELFSGNYIPVDSSAMPSMSPQWWENEWRKSNPTWRAGESTDDFFLAPYSYVKSQTGRDMSNAETFAQTHPEVSAGPAGRKRDRALRAHAHPEVLVPLCGDSRILRTMAVQGYEVTGVDASQTALQAAVERTERALPQDCFRHVHLLWKDFFSPDLWENELKGKKFDIIYERQGMTSLNREQRPDYAFLLKRALKEDGLIYVEGIFRTGRVKGNKKSGPPFSLSRKELEGLFPSSQGYFVRCEEKNDAMSQLSREDRILQRIPRSLYVTPFNCVVFRDATVNLETRSEPLAASPE